MFLLNNAQISWSSTLWWFSIPCCYGSLSYGSHCYSFQWFAMIYLWFIHQKVVVRWFSTSKTASVVSISANCDPSPFDSGRTWGNILDFVFPEIEWAGPWGHTDHVILLVGSHFWGKHTWKHWTSNVHSAYIVVTSIYDRMSLLQQMKQWPGVGVCFFSFCFCLEIQREGYAAGFLPEACPQEWCSQQSSHKVFLDVFSCFSTLVHKPQVLP